MRNLKNPELILEKCVEINRLENEADEQLRTAIAKLFKEAKDSHLRDQVERDLRAGGDRHRPL